MCFITTVFFHPDTRGVCGTADSLTGCFRHAYQLKGQPGCRCDDVIFVFPDGRKRVVIQFIRKIRGNGRINVRLVPEDFVSVQSAPSADTANRFSGGQPQCRGNICRCAGEQLFISVFPRRQTALRFGCLVETRRRFRVVIKLRQCCEPATAVFTENFSVTFQTELRGDNVNLRFTSHNEIQK